jgi:type I restriction enzyme M protein
MIKVKEGKIDKKRDLLTDEETKELLLEKFYTQIKHQLEKYLNTDKKELIKIFEKLWDKYKVSLSELTQEREEEVKRLDEFLEKLRYYTGRS